MSKELSKNGQSRLDLTKWISILSIALSFAGLVLIGVSSLYKNVQLLADSSLYVWWLCLALTFILIFYVTKANRNRKLLAIALVVSFLVAAIALMVRVNYWFNGITW